MDKYKARSVCTPGYKPERKALQFTQLYRVSFEEKQKFNQCSRIMIYSDKNTAASAKDTDPLGKTQIDSSTVYSLEKEIVYSTKKTAVKLTVKNTPMEYVPGDSILLWVSNSESICSALMDILGVCKDRWISFTRTHIRTGAAVFTYSGMASDYFRHFIDATSLPSKLFLYRISKYADQSEQDKLEYLSSKEGSKDYFKMSKNWNSIIDILVQFKVKIPLEVLLEVCTEIKPRAFSLINKQKTDCVIIAGSVTNTQEGSVRKGHFTEYAISTQDTQKSACEGSGILKNREPLDTSIVYRIQHKPNRLMALREETKNAFLFGIGTGVAPFISFIVNSGESKRFTLFYGCRSRHENILVNIGFLTGPSEESAYEGAILFRKGNTNIHVVYSQENESFRIGQFLKRNKEKINSECMIFNDLYICGNKEAMQEISEYFAENHSEMNKYIDDWS